MLLRKPSIYDDVESEKSSRLTIRPNLSLRMGRNHRRKDSVVFHRAVDLTLFLFCYITCIKPIIYFFLFPFGLKTCFSMCFNFLTGCSSSTKGNRDVFLISSCTFSWIFLGLGLSLLACFLLYLMSLFL